MANFDNLPVSTPTSTRELRGKTSWPTEGVVGPFRGELDYLSNFYEAEFDHQGIIVPTAEHAYQAAKAPSGTEEHVRIIEADGPKAAKKRGQQVALPKDWDEVKAEIMLEIVTLKFAQNFHLIDKLIETKGPIVELNDWGDRYWGADASTGEGKNMLGRVLMGLRESFRLMYS